MGEGVGALSGLVRVAVQAGLVLPAVTGLMAALGVTGLVVTVLLAATHPRLWALARRHGLVGGALTSSSGDDPGMAVTLAPWDDLSSAVTEPETPAQLRALGDRELCLAWRRSFVRLNEAQTTMERLRVVEQRQGYLDELQRRSPDALASWLVSGARAPGNPLPYLRAHRHGSLRPRD